MDRTSAGRDATNVQAATINNYYGNGSAPSAMPAGETGVLSNLPPLSPTFVPRTPITDKIHAALAPGVAPSVMRQAAARAHGGFGKTVAAILYGHQHADFYTGGRFFLSTEKADFITQLASLGRFFKVPAEARPEEAATIVKQALEAGGPSLLILDNVVDGEQWKAILASGLVPRGNCRLLITTRADHIAQTTEIKVGRLTKEEAREVYMRFCDDVRTPPTEECADAITEWLVGLAVSVAAVAARMKLLPDVSWDDYWARLRDMKVSELPDVREDVRREMGLNGEELKDYRRTLRVIDDAFDALPAVERRVVEYAALLPEDMVPGIWLEMLLAADAARKDGPLKIDMAADPDDPVPPARRAIRHLDALDLLLEKSESGKILSLHRLWRARVNERAEAEKGDRAALLQAIAACAAARRADVVDGDGGKGPGTVSNPAAMTDQTLRWELSPLAATCTHLWAKGEPGGAARVAVWLMGPLQVLGRYAEAAVCLSPVAQHEAMVEAAIGHADLAICYSNLAMIQQDQGDLQGARASMERAIAIQSKHFAPDHSTFATRYSNLAMIQKDQGDLPGARASMERAIAIDSKHFSPDHPNFAISYSNLAIIQQDQGDLPEARASMERAIAIEFKHFAPDHPTVGISYNNLAHICLAEGDRMAACSNFKKALSIFLKHFGDDHPHVKNVRNSMKVFRCKD